ncbi:MMPL family transporter [Nakamurella lactea]|uniref:MMPL family transporter n=1 Tax=Nakamurella lactea TaxID=459515 RepID=UPI001FDF3736|nr:MMPL family transporter [Nakamurella lactea]
MRRSVVRAVLLVAVIGGWLAVAGVGGQKIGELASVQSNDSTSFLPASAESVRAAEAAAAFEPVKSLPAFVVFTTAGAGTASPAQQESWNAFAAGVARIPVADGTTIGDYLAAGAVGPSGTAAVPSADGRAALVVLPLDEAKVSTAGADGQPPLDEVVAALRQAATAAAAGGTAHVTGPAGLISDLGAAFSGIDGLLLLVAVGVVLLILLIVYRALALPLLVLLSSLCGLALAGWVVYLLADSGTVTLNGQSQGILFILVIGAATDYGLLLTARYREELNRTAGPVAAMRTAWRACVEPIVASAGTVIIGLLCLLLSDLNSNRGLGPIGAIGIGGALLASLTFLPAVLMTGRWMFWPRIPRLDTTSTAPGADQSGERHRGWRRLAAVIDRHPRRIWSVTAVVLLALCAFLPSFRASGTQQSEVFLGNPDSVVGQQVLEEHFSGGTGNPVQLVVAQGDADRVAAAVAAVPGIAGPPLPFTETGGPQGPAMTVDGRVLLEATLQAGADTDAAKDTVRAVRAAVADLGLGGTVLVGGQTALQLDTQDTSDRDLRVIIPTILLAVLLVLMLLLRSLIAPLVLVLATVLSFGSALGVSALVFNHVFDFPGADPAVPLFGFVFLVALGVDYSIFLMSRAREESKRFGARVGVLHALVTTGGVITSAGVVLAATFAALGVIPILFLAQIAFIVGFGVLLDTLVVRSLLVSSLSVDLGRWIWWPSRLWRNDVSAAGSAAAGSPAAESSAGSGRGAHRRVEEVEGDRGQ